MSFKFLALTFFSLFTLFSCSKSDDSGSPKLTYKVNGTFIDASGSKGGAAAVVDATFGTQILAVTTGGNGLNLNLVSDKVGTYQLGDVFGDNSAVYQTLNDAFDTRKIGDGTLVVTSSSESNIKGTFSFTGTSAIDDKTTVKITEGFFDVPVTR